MKNSFKINIVSRGQSNNFKKWDFFSRYFILKYLIIIELERYKRKEL